MRCLCLVASEMSGKADSWVASLQIDYAIASTQAEAQARFQACPEPVQL
jgi:hypothetical protein